MIDFGYFHCLPYGEHIKIKAFQELHKTAINQEQGTECLAPKRGVGGSNPLGDGL